MFEFCPSQAEGAPGPSTGSKIFPNESHDLRNHSLASIEKPTCHHSLDGEWLAHDLTSETVCSQGRFSNFAYHVGGFSFCDSEETRLRVVLVRGASLNHRNLCATTICNSNCAAYLCANAEHTNIFSNLFLFHCRGLG